MSVSLVRVDADGRPNVFVTLSGTEDVAPLAFAGRNVEETGHAPRPRIGEHLVLPPGKAGVVKVAVAVDQLHAGTPSSSSSRRGKSGCGCAMGAPPSPAAIAVSSLSAAAGMTGATAAVSLRTASTSVPSTAAIRSGSVLR